MNRRGFVLPLALVVMVAASFMVATALQVAVSDYHANRSMRVASRSLYAAEAGVQRTIAIWNKLPYATLTPGDSMASGWISLADGSDYQTVVLRVDDGTGVEPLYRVLSEGRPSRSSTARRLVVAMIRGGITGSACCDGALSIYGRLNVSSFGAGGRSSAPTEAVDGRDNTPSLWSAYCAAPTAATSGIRIRRSQDLTLGNNVRILGTPPTEIDGTLGTDAVRTFGGTTYAALAATADVVITQSNPRYTDIAPRASGGTCTTGNTRNWGAPESPGSACWSYLPVVHAENSLRLGGSGVAQGVLLVDGNLDLSDEFHFYGLIVVQGRLNVTDDAAISGGVLVGNIDQLNQTTRIQDQSVVEYSSCALARALPRSSEAGPLPGRHWFEIS